MVTKGIVSLGHGPHESHHLVIGMMFKERESQRHKINKELQKITHFLEFPSSMFALMF